LKTSLRTVLFTGGGVVVAAVAFWAGMSTERKSDGGTRQESVAPARRTENAVFPSAAKPRALKRLVETARTVMGEEGTQVRIANRKQSAEPVKDQDVRSSLLAVLADLDGGGIKEQEAIRCIRELKGTDDRTFLKSLRAMFASTDVAERIRTLAVIEAAYGSGGTPLVIDLDADPSQEEIDLEAHRTHELVGMVGDGLRDSDKTVRDAAFDVFLSLNGDPSFVLSRQILMGDDHEQKMRLLDSVANTVTTSAIGLSMDALGNPDEAVRVAAAKNLAAATGKSFASQDEARAWWEANCEEFMASAHSSTDMNAVTISETSDSEENQPNNNQEKE